NSEKKNCIPCKDPWEGKGEERRGGLVAAFFCLSEALNNGRVGSPHRPVRPMVAEPDDHPPREGKKGTGRWDHDIVMVELARHPQVSLDRDFGAGCYIVSPYEKYDKA
ncbi:hypothetical protein B296_00037222, partial [Ensete ventricosum]